MLRSVTLAALVCALIGLGSVVGGLSQSINGPWHDRLQRLLPRGSGEEVLLVAADKPAAAVVDQVERAVSALQQAGVDGVGVLADPTRARAFRELAARYGAVVVGWPVRPGGGPATGWARPDGAPPDAPVYALAAAPGPPYRTQALAVDTPAGPAATLEAVLADATGTGASGYHVDYRGGLAGLPQMSLDRVAAGDVVRDMVAGRTALIVGDDPWTRPLYAAPVDGPGLTAGQVHAFALRTLLAGRPLTSLPPWAVTVLLLAAGLLSGGLSVWTSTRAFPWILAGVVTIGGVCVVVVMATVGLILPGVEFVLALAVPPLVVFYRRERQEDDLLARLAGAATVRARQRDLGAKTDESAWQLATRLVAENLDLSRAVFLALGDDGRRAHVVASIGPGAREIAERRQDVTRSPYTDPQAPNEPVAMTRPFFAGPGSGHEYIARLDFGGRTLGYWVFATAPDSDPATDGTLSAAPAFAERAAELLYLDRPAPGDRAGWRRLLKARAEKRLSADLAQSLTTTERRLALYEAVLARIDTAIAVYDAFGRPMHVNQAMSDVAQTAAIQPFSTTASDLLSELGGLRRDRATAFLRQAVIDGTGVSLPLDRDIGGKRYMLAVAPLAPETGVAGSLFGASGRDRQRSEGVLIAFSDYTSAANLFRLTESLGRFVNTRLRNDLENIQLASDLLADPRLPENRRTRAVELLKRAIQRADDELDLLDQQFVRDVSVERASVYPLDPLLVLQQALAAVEPLAAERGIELQPDLPALTTPALALPHELYDVLRAAAELVIDAASPGAALTVTYHEAVSATTVGFAAEGYGMPDARVQLMLDRAERDEPEMVSKLRTGRDRLRAWGGDLGVEAGLGQGVRVEITLRRAVRASEQSALTDRETD